MVETVETLYIMGCLPPFSTGAGYWKIIYSMSHSMSPKTENLMISSALITKL
jgi:hypothetical protein